MENENTVASTDKIINIPLLQPEDIDVKIKQVKENGALALLYKTARTDMDYLDRIFGPLNWIDSYEEIKGNLYCTISVWDDVKRQWISKQDCGIESREDGEGNEKKGEASDAFKRASTRFGIGRELYTSPFIWLNVETVKDNKGNWILKDRFAKFVVTDIGYENRKICRLVIANTKTGEIVYRYGVSSPSKQPTKKPTAKDSKQTPKANVEKTTALPPEANTATEEDVPMHKKLFDDFITRHNISGDDFMKLRKKALDAGKAVTNKYFKELTPDEWSSLLATMEALYEEGFFGDNA